MTTVAILESGMQFGPFPLEHCFYIEKSSCYQAIRDGVQMAEFVLLKQQNGGPALWLIEAKSSSPRPATQSFAGFIDEICGKLTNCLMLAVAAHLQRHPAASTELPQEIRSVKLQSVAFRLILVVNGHKQEWLAPLQSALSLALKPVIKTWALSATSVAVLNHELAERHGLIRPAADRAARSVIRT